MYKKSKVATDDLFVKWRERWLKIWDLKWYHEGSIGIFFITRLKRIISGYLLIRSLNLQRNSE